MTDSLLSTADAAALAGVGPTAIKRWADSGLLACVRTAGGHRRFPRSAVEALIRGRAGGPAPDAVASACDLLVDGIDEGRDVEARLLEERDARGSWWAVTEYLGDVLVELGDRWARGAITVIEEHVASERLARALARIAASLPVARAAPACLLVAADGDDHTLGLSLVELCLREAGWRTRWAGRGTPTRDVVRLIERGGLAMVALSGSVMSKDRRRLGRQASALAKACSAHAVTLVLGGRGAWPAVRAARRFTDLTTFASFARKERAR